MQPTTYTNRLMGTAHGAIATASNRLYTSSIADCCGRSANSHSVTSDTMQSGMASPLNTNIRLEFHIKPAKRYCPQLVQPKSKKIHLLYRAVATFAVPQARAPKCKPRLRVSRSKVQQCVFPRWSQQLTSGRLVPEGFCAWTT
jgi:hypothetical protein